MPDVSNRVLVLPKEIEVLMTETFGVGKVGGSDPTAAGGVVTFPAGYLISCPARGQGRSELLRLTEAVDVAAVDGDEVFLTHRSGSALFELVASASTPAGSLKLGDASGTPVDTFSQDAAVGGIGIGGGSATEFAVLTLSANQVANLGGAEHVEFDTIVQDSSAIFALATGAGQLDGILTVPEGEYVVLAMFTIAGAASGNRFSAQPYNVTGAAFIPGVFGFARVLTNTQDKFHANLAVGLLSVGAAGVDIELRILGNSGITALESGAPTSDGQTWMVVVKR